MSERAIEQKNSKGTGKLGNFLRFLLSFLITCFVGICMVCFLLYGPVSTFRDELITKSLGTMTHQWIAPFLFDKTEIAKTLASNETIDPEQNTNPNGVIVPKSSSTPQSTGTALPETPADGERIIDGVGFIRLKGPTYTGWAVKVYDPSRVKMQLASTIGTQGELCSDMCKEHDAFVGLNAGGFADVGGQGTGGLPTGVCVADGQLITSGVSGITHKIIGLDFESRLILGNYSLSQVKAMHFKDALEFRPFLIVNGVKANIVGNGGLGTDPRTAIGQTPKGVLIFLVINGRHVDSAGATMKDLQDLMWSFGAVNAANLDGGSSSTLVYNDKVINNPSSKGGERYLPSAFLISHTKGWSGS